jgi:hypothetical protein
MSRRGEIINQALLGIEFGVLGPGRLLAARKKQDQEKRSIPPYHS